MADVGKLINLGTLLVWKVRWLVLTTTPATLILSPAFGATVWQGLPTYTLVFQISFSHFSTYRDNTLPLSPLWLPETAHSLILSIATYRDNSLSLWHFDCQQSTPRKCIHSATFFFLVLPVSLDFFQPRTQPQKFRQTPKETNNQHRKRHVPPRTCCYISIYLYLTWNT